MTGAARGGKGLLSGLLRCAHCGRKLHVQYSGKGGLVGRYECRGASVNHGTGRCINFGNVRVDNAVSEELLRVLSPIGVDAALAAHTLLKQQGAQEREQYQLALEQARIEADRAQRQFDRVEPENRLVAAELERRWNKQLAVVAQRSAALERYDTQHSDEIDEAICRRLTQLATDLPSVWAGAENNNALKKRILRTALEEIVVEVIDDTLRLRLHWCGGDHTLLQVKKNRSGEHRYSTSAEVVTVIEALARHLPDQGIAALLNRLGYKTSKGNSWTQNRVCGTRNKRGIAVYEPGERQARAELLLVEAAERLGVPQRAVRTLIDKGDLPAKQVCPGAPWIILEKDVVEFSGKDAEKGPSRVNSRQNSLDLQ